MLKYTLRTDSLIHRLIDVYTPWDFASDNICGLIWQVLVSTVLILFGVIVTSVVLGGFLDFALWWTLNPDGELGLFGATVVLLTLTIIISSIIAGLIIGVFTLINNYSLTDMYIGRGRLGFLGAAFISINKKICFPVETVYVEERDSPLRRLQDYVREYWDRRLKTESKEEK